MLLLTLSYPAEEELESLLMRAKSTIKSVQQNQDQYTPAAREECETFDRLQTIRNLLTAADGYVLHHCDDKSNVYVQDAPYGLPLQGLWCVFELCVSHYAIEPVLSGAMVTAGDVPVL